MTDPPEMTPTDRTDDSEEVNEVEATARLLDPADDDALLAELKVALAQARHDRDDQVIAAAQDAFSFLAISEEFAELVFDSLWEDKLETASRSLATVRTLTFESSGLSVEIEAFDGGFVGQVSPPGIATVEAECADGRRSTAETDEFGSFTLASPGTGPTRFRLSRGATNAVTEWFNAPADQ